MTLSAAVSVSAMFGATLALAGIGHWTGSHGCVTSFVPKMRSFVAMLPKMFKYVTRVLFDTRNWTFDYFRVEYLDSSGGDLARPAQCLISV